MGELRELTRDRLPRSLEKPSEPLSASTVCGTPCGSMNVVRSNTCGCGSNLAHLPTRIAQLHHEIPYATIAALACIANARISARCPH